MPFNPIQETGFKPIQDNPKSKGALQEIKDVGIGLAKGIPDAAFSAAETMNTVGNTVLNTLFPGTASPAQQYQSARRLGLSATLDTASNVREAVRPNNPEQELGAFASNFIPVGAAAKATGVAGKALGLTRDAATASKTALAEKTANVAGKFTNLTTKKTEASLNEAFTATKSARSMLEESTAKGHNAANFIASDTRYVPEVFNDKISSAKAIANLNNEAAPLAEIIRAHIDNAGVAVHADQLKAAALKEIEGLKDSGAVHANYSAKIGKDLEHYITTFTNGDGMLNLSKLDDIKKAKYAMTYGLDAEGQASKIADVAVARAARKIIESNIKDVNIAALNKELSKYYDARDMLEVIDGTTVKGGRLGGYFARGIGAAVGSSHGPHGALAGALTADKIASIMRSNYFGSSKVRQLLGNLKKDRPEIFKEAEALLQKEKPQLPPIENPAR
jgi:hypothetical protein